MLSAAGSRKPQKCAVLAALSRPCTPPIPLHFPLSYKAAGRHLDLHGERMGESGRGVLPCEAVVREEPPTAPEAGMAQRARDRSRPAETTSLRSARCVGGCGRSVRVRRAVEITCPVAIASQVAPPVRAKYQVSRPASPARLAGSSCEFRHRRSCWRRYLT